jgi:hypothetical protein
MPWTYNQANGALSHQGQLVTSDGYSGFGLGKNNPSLQGEPNVGPIPVGSYAIGDEIQSELLGPVALPLEPLAGTDTLGRGGFWIHGDSIQHPGSASHGCVILPRPVRLGISQSDDKVLQVV